MKKLFVTVIQLSDTIVEDAEVTGTYTVMVPDSVSPYAAANIALDVFHTHVAIDNLDKFGITVFDEHENEMQTVTPGKGEKEWESYSGSELGTFLG